MICNCCGCRKYHLHWCYLCGREVCENCFNERLEICDDCLDEEDTGD